MPCPPHKPSPSSSDPYKTLGLPNHDATSIQIKVAYRKLALRYHPDRQCRTPSPVTAGASTGGQPSSSSDSNKEATDKFTEIAAAYAILSDPAKKIEYDHLYKFGAFDNDVDNNGNQDSISGHNNTNTNASAKTNNYRYTEDMSGGYYKPGYIPPKPSTTSSHYAASAAAASFQQQAAAAFQNMQSQDSFFDDLIYSPKSSSKKDPSFFASADNDDDGDGNGDDNPSTSNSRTDNKKKQPGIGFSFTPLGKHLSVHVPSRNEIINNGLNTHNRPKNSGGHLFGTRVTYSAQQTSTSSSPSNNNNTTSGSGSSSGPLGKLERMAACTPDNACIGSSSGSSRRGGSNKKKVVSTTTTRIARGQKRIVKRTAHLHPDGTKEVVIEENGVVRRRYVEKENRDDSEDGSDDKDDDGGGSGSGSGSGGGLQKEGGFTLLGLFKSCLAPCASAG